jgi:hypothetical protein
MKTRVEMANWNTDSVSRLGKTKGSRPILVRFTLYLKKYEILLNTRILAGSGIRIDQDYSAEIRKVRKELIPYMIDARGRGHRTFLRGEKLVVNGRSYELGYLRENIPIEACRQTVDSPVYATAKETSKHNKTPQDLASTAENRRDKLVEARTKSKESGEGRDLTSREGRKEKEATSRGRTSLSSADEDRTGIADAAMIRGPTEDDTCVCSSPGGSLIEIKARQHNRRSWLMKRSGRAAVEEEGPRKLSGTN